MLFLIAVLILAAYWWYTKRHRNSSFVDLNSAHALDPDEVQLLVARVPANLKKLTVMGDAGCEYDAFVGGLSVIDKPIVGGTANLTRLGKEELIVVQKKNITLERAIVPSVVRFH